MTDRTETCRSWCAGDPAALAYHDSRWCVPCHDDRELFAMLCLEGQQAGLAWILILRREAGMREAFDGFDPHVLARWDEARIEETMKDPRVIRNRAKIRSVVSNAQAYERLLSEGEFGTFDEYVWHFTGGRTVTNRPKVMADLPAEDGLSRRVSRDLKKRGFSFVGPVTAYSFLQGVGVIDDHLDGCRFKPSGRIE